MSMKRAVVALLGALMIAGCTPNTRPDEGQAEPVGPSGATQEEGFRTQPAPDGSGFGEGAGFGETTWGGPVPGEAGSRTIVYFDFDSDAIRPEYSEMLAAHAAYLADNPDASVRLEGHADERGSREYNIGLGERRAQSVRRALLLQGVGAAQVSTVSYGEERPAVTGGDEEAWSMNRRVEIVYPR
ncbi:MAG: peptidoglycan-associated lipoprotein Pal [Gammaproteobacteria bacterium]|jgi:peptidoglycan-associated lipoprotein